MLFFFIATHNKLTPELSLSLNFDFEISTEYHYRKQT